MPNDTCIKREATKKEKKQLEFSIETIIKTWGGGGVWMLWCSFCPADYNALLWFLTCYLIVAAVRQHRIGQPWLGPTRACADFTDFKKTAISQKLSHL